MSIDENAAEQADLLLKKCKKQKEEFRKCCHMLINKKCLSGKTSLLEDLIIAVDNRSIQLILKHMDNATLVKALVGIRNKNPFHVILYVIYIPDNFYSLD